MMRIFLKRTFPFCFIKAGQRVIQVGCAEWLIDFGVSQALIMSAIVGPKGKVLVVEPDERNIIKLVSYIRKNKITNIDFIKTGVWKFKGKMNFTVYDDRSSTNVLSTGQKRILKHQTTPQEYISRSNDEVEIDVDSLDNIINRTGFSPDFINMTINGTEFEAIQGLDETLQKKPFVAFPIWGPRDWFESAFEFLESKGYDIVVCDAPYTRRAPNIGGKIRFWKIEETPQHFYACAIKQNMKEVYEIEGIKRDVKFQRSNNGKIKVIMS